METGDLGVCIVSAPSPVALVCRHGPGPVQTQPHSTVVNSVLVTTLKMLFVRLELIAQLMVAGHFGEIGASASPNADGAFKNAHDFALILHRHTVVATVMDQP